MQHHLKCAACARILRMLLEWFEDYDPRAALILILPKGNEMAIKGKPYNFAVIAMNSEGDVVPVIEPVVVTSDNGNVVFNADGTGGVDTPDKVGPMNLHAMSGALAAGHSETVVADPTPVAIKIVPAP